MSDAKTIAVYEREAARYADGHATPKDPEHAQDVIAFTSLIPTGGHIHDLGCGPGHWAATFRDMGYAVSASDASQSMADLAKTRYQIDVPVQPFEAFKAVACYDGIWANFSLLHALKSAFADHLSRIHTALKPKGALHLGMKLGTGEARDSIGRYYSYYSEEELNTYLKTAGFTPLSFRHGRGTGLSGDISDYATVTAHA